MPVSIVRTFQVPSFRAGLFSSFRAGLFLFFLLLPGALVAAAFRMVPNPHAPNEDSRPWRYSTFLSGGCPA